jgi:hypothetical protein
VLSPFLPLPTFSQLLSRLLSLHPQPPPAALNNAGACGCAGNATLVFRPAPFPRRVLLFQFAIHNSPQFPSPVWRSSTTPLPPSLFSYQGISAPELTNDSCPVTAVQNE